MRKLISLLMILIVCLVATPLIAVEVSDEWLESIKDQLTYLQGEVNALTEELNDKDLLIDAYRQALEETEYRLDQQTGWYLGGNVTYPWGGEAIAQYKFERWGPYLLGGYTQDVHIGLGVLIKVGKK